MKIFLSIEDMPIYNFDKALTTGNMSYLVLKWDERKEIKYIKGAKERWEEIYNQYCEKSANNETLTQYALMNEISYLEMRYLSVVSLIECLCEGYKEELGRALNKWGFVFNIKGKILPQIDNLKRQLRGAKQKIDVRKSKLKSLKGDEEKESSLIAQAISLEKILGIKLNIRKDSVDKWIELNNLAKETVQQQKTARNG